MIQDLLGKNFFPIKGNVTGGLFKHLISIVLHLLIIINNNKYLLYISYILPIMTYAYPIWGFSYNTSLHHNIIITYDQPHNKSLHNKHIRMFAMLLVIYVTPPSVEISLHLLLKKSVVDLSKIIYSNLL